MIISTIIEISFNFSLFIIRLVKFMINMKKKDYPEEDDDDDDEDDDEPFWFPEEDEDDDDDEDDEEPFWFPEEDDDDDDDDDEESSASSDEDLFALSADAIAVDLVLSVNADACTWDDDRLSSEDANALTSASDNDLVPCVDADPLTSADDLLSFDDVDEITSAPAVKCWFPFFTDNADSLASANISVSSDVPIDIEFEFIGKSWDIGRPITNKNRDVNTKNLIIFFVYSLEI